MNKKHLLIAIGALGVLTIVVAILMRRPPQVKSHRPKKAAPTQFVEQPERDWREGPIVTVPQPKPDFKSADPKELARALDDASIQSLIDNLKVAAEQSDDTTMRAMIAGLQKRGSAARALVEREMARLPADSNAYYAMREVIR